MKGTTMREINPGIIAATNQFIHVIWTCAVFSAKLCAIGLPAIAVKNIAEVIKLPWNSVKIKNAPIFLSEPSFGDEPNDSDKDLMIGNIIPPARAVLLGVAGAKIRSTPTSE